MKVKRLLYFSAVLICLGKQDGNAQRITLVNDGYTVVYNTKTNLAEKVVWDINPANLGRLTRTSAFRFKVDRRCPTPRARSKDYTRSGYQRGHLAPAGDFTAKYYLLQQTFLLSNVAPMREEINSGAWYRSEVRCRAEAIRLGGVRVKVYTEILSPDTVYLKGSHVAIPTLFRKELWTLSGDSLITEWYIVQK